MASTLDALVQHGVVPVVRTPNTALALRAVTWLRDAGLGTFEITLTIPDAMSLVRELASDASLHIGVGTVLNATQAEQCVQAGARYLVSPAVCPSVVAPCREAGVPCVLGACTPTEVMSALAAGSAAVKIFPVSSLGGAAHIKALKAVFPDVMLAPTGGIGVDEIATYLGAGSSFVGVGGKLVDVAALQRNDQGAITTAAKTALSQVALARG
ncbi:MAG: 2-dehydro-3-deoxyphosphogluconate aldolase/(4S)-4-hydroxy-2-oxoglutarate aldolase [Gammaproteobacteria bacterium]|jgi:2-dehydro-3-deoxyphosphogluconate aldolase/(4S)-4-hydroxy-2-oxoglutarate aldolase